MASDKILILFGVIAAYFSYPLLFFIFLLGFIVPIFPEELVLLASGFLSYLGFANVWIVMPVALGGIVLADTIGYSIGRWKGKDALMAMAHRFRMLHKMLVKGEKIFNRYDDHAVIFGRFVAGARFAVPILAGAFGMSWKRFLRYDTMGAAIWVLLTVGIGYAAGYTLDVSILSNGKWIGVGILFIIAGVYGAYKMFWKRVVK